MAKLWRHSFCRFENVGLYPLDILECVQKGTVSQLAVVRKLDVYLPNNLHWVKKRTGYQMGLPVKGCPALLVAQQINKIDKT